MWSIGCIFGELILREPLLPGKGEIDQISKVSFDHSHFDRDRKAELVFRFQIFKLLGRPTDEMWPGFRQLPNAKSFNLEAAPP